MPRLIVDGFCLFTPVLLQLKTDTIQSKQKRGSLSPAKSKSAAQFFVRVGYDLFSEVRHLLCNGQPVQFANVPSIEIHITILRDLLIEYQIRVRRGPSGTGGLQLHRVPDSRCGPFCDPQSQVRSHHPWISLSRELWVLWWNFSRDGNRHARLRVIGWLFCRFPLVYLGIVPDFWSKPERYLGTRSCFYLLHHSQKRRSRFDTDRRVRFAACRPLRPFSTAKEYWRNSRPAWRSCRSRDRCMA